MSKMPTWEEWSSLSDEQREYSLYKVLVALSSHDSRLDAACAARVEACSTRFEKLDGKIDNVKKHRWFDKMVSTIIGAAVGVATAIGILFGGG